MKDRYALLSTAYAWTSSAHYAIRETDDPPLTAHQQLARALRWHRVLNGWSQQARGLATGLDRSYREAGTGVWAVVGEVVGDGCRTVV